MVQNAVTVPLLGQSDVVPPDLGLHCIPHIFRCYFEISKNFLAL